VADRAPQLGPVVETAHGLLRGCAEGGLSVFRGIPYALPPTGERRWRAPQPPEAWRGVRDATAFGPAAVQAPGEPPFGDLFANVPTDEDCLTLNVWTPDLEPAQPRPVLVWIHGGGLADGTAADPLYAGDTFARDGLVFVSINYRLGALGFLHLAELFDGYDDAGNLGLLDQVAALRWVRDNIAAFGGDAGAVTIAGESAGAWSVASLMAMPAARGLFHRAICSSGAGDHALDPDAATRVARRFLDAAGVRPGDREALLALTPEEVVAAQEVVYGDAMGSPETAAALLGDAAGLIIPLLPVIDGAVLRALPQDAVGAGSARGIPLLIGTNRDEYGLYRLLDGGIFTAEHLRWYVERGLNGATFADATALYGGSGTAALDAMETDRFFRAPAIALAERQARWSDVYAYRLDWAGTERYGSCHVMDVPLVFGRPDHPPTRALIETIPPAEVAAGLHAAWSSFARGGPPTSVHLPPWSTYDRDRRRTMLIDAPESRMVGDPERKRRSLWRDRNG
jgi:para-nitrobenzyl esterase